MGDRDRSRPPTRPSGPSAARPAAGVGEAKRSSGYGETAPLRDPETGAAAPGGGAEAPPPRRRKTRRTLRDNKPGRKSGFEPPYSEEQVRSWISQSLGTILFYGVAVPFYLLSGEVLIFYLLCAETGLVVVGAYMWLFLETHNPAEESCWGRCLPDSPRFTKLHYSREHRAKIPGLDHHCAWLNVSIGRWNYLPFYILVMAGACQFFLQFATGLLMLTVYAGEVSLCFGTYAIVFDAALALNELLSGYIGLSYALLGYFHTYLFCKGLSTYDWMMQQRKAHQEYIDRLAEARAVAAASGGTAKPVYSYSQANDPALLCIPCLFDNNVVIKQ